MRLPRAPVSNIAPAPPGMLAAERQTLEASLEAALLTLHAEALASNDAAAQQLLRQTSGCLRAVARLCDEFTALEAADQRETAALMLRFCIDAYACFNDEWRPAIDAARPAFLDIDGLAAEIGKQAETSDAPVRLQLIRGGYIVTLTIATAPHATSIAEHFENCLERVRAAWSGDEAPRPAAISLQVG